MTRNEKKLFAFGAAAGIALAILAGVLAINWPRLHAVKGTATTAVAEPAPTPPEISGPQPGATLQLSPAEMTAAGVQVAAVRTARLKTDIESFGRVEQPEAQLAAISARIGGRVDKLYVQYTGEKRSPRPAGRRTLQPRSRNGNRGVSPRRRIIAASSPSPTMPMRIAG